MAYIKLDNIASSKGKDCEVMLSGIEWHSIRLFWEITSLNLDDNGALIFNPPLSGNLIQGDGLQYLEVSNQGSYNAVRVICRESVIVFGNDEQISIHVGTELKPALSIFRSDSEVKPIKNGISIVESKLTGFLQEMKDQKDTQLDWKDRLMPDCPDCGKQLLRPEIGQDNIHKLLDVSHLAVNGNGLMIGNCSKCGKEYVVLTESGDKIFKIVKEISTILDGISDSVQSDQNNENNITNSQKEVEHKAVDDKKLTTDHSKKNKQWWKFW